MIGMITCNGRNQWTLAGRVLLLGGVALLAGAFCQLAFGAAPVTAPVTAPRPKSAEPDTKPRPKAEQADDERSARFGKISVQGNDPMGEDRVKRIKSLVAIIRSEELVAKDRTKLFNAIYRLGRMKAVEGAAAIAERLDLHLTASGMISSFRMPARDVEYPAIKALVGIGEGALPYIADALFAQKRSATFRSNALLTIHMIMDGDLAKAQKYLRDRLAMYNAATKELPKMLASWGAVINQEDYSSPAPPEKP